MKTGIFWFSGGTGSFRVSEWARKSSGTKFSIGLEIALFISTFTVLLTLRKKARNKFYFISNLVMNAWTLFLYWTVGLSYLWMELYAWPKWMFRRKVQPDIVVDRKRLYSV